MAFQAWFGVIAHPTALNKDQLTRPLRATRPDSLVRASKSMWSPVLITILASKVLLTGPY